MRSLVNWKDMVCEFPNRFAQTVEGNKVTLQRSPGTVRTQGCLLYTSDAADD